MASVNKVIIIGHLGRDPEIRSMQSGDRVATLSVATSESWKDKATGERRDKTEWHKVVIFNDNLAKIAEQCLSKGSKVYIEGALQTRKWKDKEGQERTTTEIVVTAYKGQLVLLDGRQTDPSERATNGNAQGSRAAADDGFGDDIPF